MMRSGRLWRQGLALILFAGITAGLAQQGTSYGDGSVIPLPLPPGPPAPPPGPPPEPPDPPPPVVKIKVRVPACVPAGKAIEYRICVENCSPAEAHHVVVKNPVPANAKFVKADPEPARHVPELQWHLGTVGGHATREIVLWLMPTDLEEIKNCARVQFEHGQCVVTRPSAFPGQHGPFPPGTVPPGTVPPGTTPPVTTVPPGTTTPGKDKKGADVRPVPPVVDTEAATRLSLVAQGHKQQYINLPSRYFITVKNEGKTRATNVLVNAALPGKAAFLHASEPGQFLERQVAWFVGNLEPGQARTVELALKSPDAGEWCVKVTARADRGAHAEADVCTQFLGVSALTVELADREDPVIVGGKTSYPILIRQQGSAAVTNLRIRALIPPTLKLERTQPAEFQKEKDAPEGQWIVLPAIPSLDVGGQASFEIFVEALRVGEGRLHIEVFADQLERHPVIEEEHTTIFDDERGPQAPPKF